MKKYTKRGSATVQYIIITAILTLSTITLTMVWFPEEVGKLTTVFVDGLNVMWHGSADIELGDSIGMVPDYPTNEDDWTPSIDFSFNEGSTIEITGYLGASANIVIPDTIKGKTVDKIASYAFDGENLESVLIPSGVKQIGSGAFQNNKLKTIKLPKGLTILESQVFMDNEITAVTIPSGVVTIETSAFENNKVSTLRMGVSLIDIGNKAFHGNSLSKIIFNESLETIGINAFSANQLTTIEIGGNVTRIGLNAFNDQRVARGVVVIDGVSDRFDDSWLSYFDQNYKRVK